MKATKIAFYMILALSLTATQCKKKDQAAPAAEEKKVELTGTPAQKMTQVMNMGVSALQDSPDTKAAATKIQKLLKDYDVAALRAEAKTAKEAGQGATEEEIAAYKAAVEAYKKLAMDVGGKDPAAFNAAAEAWAKAWGIN